MKGATPCPDTATLSSDFTIQIKPFISRPSLVSLRRANIVRLPKNYYGFHLKHWMSLVAFELDT